MENTDQTVDTQQELESVNILNQEDHDILNTNIPVLNNISNEETEELTPRDTEEDAITSENEVPIPIPNYNVGNPTNEAEADLITNPTIDPDIFIMLVQ